MSSRVRLILKSVGVSAVVTTAFENMDCPKINFSLEDAMEYIQKD